MDGGRVQSVHTYIPTQYLEREDPVALSRYQCLGAGAGAGTGAVPVAVAVKDIGLYCMYVQDRCREEMLNVGISGISMAYFFFSFTMKYSIR